MTPIDAAIPDYPLGDARTWPEEKDFYSGSVDRR